MEEPISITSQGSNVHTFKVGEIVEVMRRMWPGMNKPGGIARIINLRIDSDNDELLIDVAYVVGGRESNIEEKYVKQYEVESGRRRVQGRCRFCGSFIHDCLHDQTVDPSALDPTVSTESDANKKRALDSFNNSIKAVKPKAKKIRVNSAESLQQRKEQREKEKFDRLNEETSRWWEELMDSQQQEANLEPPVANVSKEANLEPPIGNVSIPFRPDLPPSNSRNLNPPPPSSSSSSVNLNSTRISDNVSRIQPLAPLSTPSSHLTRAVHLHPHIQDVLAIAKAIKQHHSPVDQSSYLRARDLHKEIFTHCVRESSTMSPFIRGEERVSGEIYINATYNSLMRQMDDLSLTEKWEMLVLAHNLVCNLHQRALQFKPKQLHLAALCDDLYSRRLNSEVSEEGFKQERCALAHQIFNLDEQQESLFKQIERAGFELTTKLPIKIGAILKSISKGEYGGGGNNHEEVQAARKVVKSRLQALQLEVDTVSTQFKDVMHYAKIGKGGRGGIVNLCKTFETSLDKSVEDVVDEEDSDSEEEEDDYSYERGVQEDDDTAEIDEEFIVPTTTAASRPYSKKSYFSKKRTLEDSQETYSEEPERDGQRQQQHLGNDLNQLTNKTQTPHVAPISSWDIVRSTLKKHKGGKGDKNPNKAGRVTDRRDEVFIVDTDCDVEQDLLRNCKRPANTRRSSLVNDLYVASNGVDNFRISKETFESARQRQRSHQIDASAARIVEEAPSLVNEILDDMLVPPQDASSAKDLPGGDVVLSLLQTSPGEMSISSSPSGKEAMYNFLNCVWNGVESTMRKSFYSLDSQAQDDFIANFLTMLYAQLCQDLSLLFEQISVSGAFGDNLPKSKKDAIVRKTENFVRNLVGILFDDGLLFTYLSLKRSLMSSKSSIGDDDHYLVYIARMSEITKKLEQGLVSIGVAKQAQENRSSARSSLVDAWLAVVTQDEDNSLFASLYSFVVGNYLHSKQQYNHRVFIKLQSRAITKRVFHFILILSQINESFVRNVLVQLLFRRDLLYSVILHTLQSPKSLSIASYKGFELPHSLLSICMLAFSYSEKLTIEIAKCVKEYCKPPLSLPAKLAFMFQLKFLPRMLHYAASAMSITTPQSSFDCLSLHDALKEISEESPNELMKFCDALSATSCYLTNSLRMDFYEATVSTTISAEQIWLILGLCIYAYKGFSPQLTFQQSVAGSMSNNWHVVKRLSEQYGNSVRKALCANRDLALENLSRLYAYGMNFLSRLPKLCWHWDGKHESYGTFVGVVHTLANLNVHIKAKYARKNLVGQSSMSLVEERKKLVQLSAFVSSSMHSIKAYGQDVVYLYDVNGSKVIKSILHHRLLQVVSLLFIRSNVYNPYSKYLHSFLREATSAPTISLPPSLEEDPVGESLDRVRQYLQELLQACVVDNHNNFAVSNANSPLSRKLRLSVGMENKNLFSVVGGVQNNFENMLTVLLCIKELCHVYNSYSLIEEYNYVDLVVQQISSQPIYKDPVNVHSETESNLLRSCLIFFTSCVVFNPFPIPSSALSSSDGNSSITTEYGSLAAFVKLQSLLLAMQQVYYKSDSATGQEETVHTLVLYALQCSMAIADYLSRFIQLHLEASTDESMMQLYEQFVMNYSRLLVNFVHANVNTGSSKVTVKEYSCLIVNHLFTLTSFLSMHVEATIVHHFVLGFSVNWQQTWMYGVYSVLFGAPVGGLMPHVRIILSTLLRQCNECSPSYMLSCSVCVPNRIYQYSTVLTNHPLNLLVHIYSQEVILRTHLLQTHPNSVAMFDGYGQLMAALNANLKEDNYSVVFSKFLYYLSVLGYIHDSKNKLSHGHAVSCLEKWLDEDKRKDILLTGMGIIMAYNARQHLFIGDHKENHLEQFVLYMKSGLLSANGSLPMHRSLSYSSLLKSFQYIFDVNMSVDNLTAQRLISRVYRDLAQSVYGSNIASSAYIKEMETLCSMLNSMIFRSLRHIQHCMFQHASNHQHSAKLASAHEELVRSYLLFCNHRNNIRDLKCAASCLPLCSIDSVALFSEEFLGYYVEGVCTLLLTPSSVASASTAKVKQYLQFCTLIYLNMIPFIPFATRCTQWEVMLAPMFAQDDARMFKYILTYWSVLLSIPGRIFLDRAEVQRLLDLIHTSVVGEDEKLMNEAVVDLQEFFVDNASMAFPHDDYDDLYNSLCDYLIGQSSPLIKRVGDRFKALMNMQPKIDLLRVGDDLRKALSCSVIFAKGLHRQLIAF